MEHKIEKLPKWARTIISDLEAKIREKDIDRNRLEAMLPWAEEGMEWFTIGSIEHDPYSLFILSKDSAQCVCALGANDRLFVGRSKQITIK